MSANHKAVAAAVLAGMLAWIARGEYPSIETARVLFSPGNLNSTNSFYHSEAYRSFMADMSSSPLPPAEVSKEMESFIISAITSTVITVSTNAVDDGTPVRVMEDRGSAFWGLSLAFSNFPTNAELCLTLARFIGTLKPADFPTPLARRWGGPVKRMILATNEADLAEERKRMETFEREYNAKRERQVRIYAANKALSRFRNDLFRMCRRAVKGCRRTMPQDQYTVFTNELIRVSGASRQEADMVLDSWRNALHRTEAYPSHGANVELEVEFPGEKPDSSASR